MFLTAGTFDESIGQETCDNDEEGEDDFLGVEVDKEEDDEEAFDYVAGYVGRKLGYEPAEEVNTGEWIDLVGGVKFHHPSENIKTMCRKCNDEFNDFHGNSLKNCKDPIKKLQKLINSKHPDIPQKVSKLFCNVKFYSRLKRLNNKIKRSNKMQSVRALKQVAQFSN